MESIYDEKFQQLSKEEMEIINGGRKYRWVRGRLIHTDNGVTAYELIEQSRPSFLGIGLGHWSNTGNTAVSGCVDSAENDCA